MPRYANLPWPPISFFCFVCPLSFQLINQMQVLQLKQKLEADYKQAVSWQKLIYAGKILVDDTNLSEYNIKQGDFLVWMVRKVPTTLHTHKSLTNLHLFSFLSIPAGRSSGPHYTNTGKREKNKKCLYKKKLPTR